MSRMIDADPLEREYQELYKLFTWDDGEREKATLARVIQMLHAQPTIEERKKGEWIDGHDERFVKCSKCGMETTRNELRGIALFGKEEPYFCPNCGADMRGV